MELNDRIATRISTTEKLGFAEIAEREGFEKLAWAFRALIREAIARGYIRQPMPQFGKSITIGDCNYADDTSLRADPSVTD